jgi:hypothetical protein
MAARLVSRLGPAARREIALAERVACVRERRIRCGSRGKKIHFSVGPIAN